MASKRWATVALLSASCLVVGYVVGYNLHGQPWPVAVGVGLVVAALVVVGAIIVHARITVK